MILDYLISKYLDGDLSPEEDVHLRELVAADPLARDAFEEAALLHVEMATAGLPEVPADLDLEVRRQVAERMSPQRRTSKPPSDGVREYGRWTAMRVMVTALLLVAALPFGDMTLGPFMPRFERNEQRDVVRLSTETLRTQSTMQPVERAANVPVDFEASETLADIPSSSDVHVAEVRFAAVETAVDVVQGSDAAAAPSRTLYVQDVLSIGGTNGGQSEGGGHSAMSTMLGHIPMYSTSPIEQMRVPARVATSYGLGTIQGGSDVGTVEQLSISIGYGIDDGTSIGLEIGSMQYDVIAIHRGLTGRSSDGDQPVDIETYSLGAQSATPTSHDSKIGAPSRSGDGKVAEFQGRRSVQTMWGAVRLQQDLVSIGPATIIGGVAVGLANDSPMGYGRLGLRCAVFNDATVYVGAQMQWLSLETGGLRATGPQVTLSRVASITFGIGVSL